MAETAIAIGVSILASVAASALAPKPPTIGKLNDISTQKSELGVPIPRIFGTYRVVGNVFWAKDLNKNESGGGKKSPSVASYNATFAALFSQCVDKTTGVDTIKQVYFNQRLILDLSDTASWATALTPALGGYYSNQIDSKYLKRVEMRRGLNTQDKSLLLQLDGEENPNNYSSNPGLVYAAFSGVRASKYFGSQIPAVEAVILDATDPSLESVVKTALSLAGIPDSKIDVAPLSTETVLGDKLDFEGSGVISFLENLALVYNFSLFETSQGVVKARFNDTSTNITTPHVIDQGVLNWHEYGNPQGEGIQAVTITDVELPSSIELSYRQFNNEFRTGTQRFIRPEAATINEIKINTSTALTDATASRLVRRLMESYLRERTTYSNILLSLNYDFIEIADSIQFTLNNRLVTAKVTRKQIGANGIIELDAVSQTVRSLEEEVVTDGSYNPLEPASGFPDLTNVVLDTPILSADTALTTDSLRQRWFSYAAAATYNNAILSAAIGADPYTTLSTETSRVAYGTLVTHLLPSDPNTIQNQEIIVTLNQGTVDNSSELGLLSGTHMLLIGNEVISYRDVTLPVANQVTFSTLLRGQRGTEFAVTTHTPGTPVYIVKGTTGEPSEFALPVAALNQAVDYVAAVDGDDDLGTTPVNVKTVVGASLRPYSVTNIKTTARSSGALDVSWIRRTRYNGDTWDNTDTVPLNEASEAYYITVTQIPTITDILLTDPNYSIAASVLAANGLTAFSNLTITISQISAIYGRGTPATRIGNNSSYAP